MAHSKIHLTDKLIRLPKKNVRVSEGLLTPVFGQLKVQWTVSLASTAIRERSLSTPLTEHLDTDMQAAESEMNPALDVCSNLGSYLESS